MTTAPSSNRSALASDEGLELVGIRMRLRHPAPKVAPAYDGGPGTICLRPHDQSPTDTETDETRHDPPEPALEAQLNASIGATAGLLVLVIGVSASGGPSSSTAATNSSTTAHTKRSGAAGGGSNARSGPAAGGSTGTVSSLFRVGLRPVDVGG
jgi:hypothetical protein